MKRIASVVVMTLGISLALAGCSIGALHDQPTSTRGSAVESDAPQLLVSPDSSRAGDGAVIEGKLAVVNNACFGLDNGTTVSTAIFPKRTSIVDPSTIRIPGVGTLKLGQKFTGGGGNIDASFSGVKVPAECATPEIPLIRTK